MSDETASQSPIKITWLIGTLAAFALFAVIASYSARMTRDYSDYDRERAKARYETLAKVRHAEQALLSPVDAQGKPSAEWVDQAKGVVRIPIEEAMAREIDTLKSKPAASGGEIPGTVPSAPAKAAPAAKTTATSTTAKPATTTLPPANLNESKP